MDGCVALVVAEAEAVVVAVGEAEAVAVNMAVAVAAAAGDISPVAAGAASNKFKKSQPRFFPKC